MKKKVLSLLLAGILGVGLLAGCGSNEESAPAAAETETEAETTAEDVADTVDQASEEETETEEENDEDDEVHLVMTALTFVPLTEEQTNPVEERLNEITKEKINATVDIQWMDTGSYLTSIPMMLQANEQIDLMMFTPIPVCGFQSFMNQKQLLDITDLLPEYAPEVNELMKDYLAATSQNGRVYGVGNMSCFEQHLSTDMRKDMLEEMGLLEEAQNIKSWPEFVSLLEKVAANTDMNAIVNNDAEGTVISPQPYLAGSGDFADAGWVDNCGDSYFFTYADPADNKIKCFFENEKWIESMRLVREMYNKGLVYKDAMSAQEGGLSLMRSEIGFCTVSATELGAVGQAENTTGFPDLNIIIADGKISSNTFQKFGFAVPVTSNEPEAALKLLNLMWTDEEFYNTITWGIEGEDWVRNADGMATYPEGKNSENVYHTADFLFGNRLEIIPWEGQDADIRQQMKDSNSKTEMSEFFGFTVDSTNVANQVTAVKAVVDEYKAGLSSGSLTDDVDGKIKEMTDKMYAAGLQEIIDEYQSQLDAWLAAKEA